MKLEDRVCRLELAKKLKELGVPQDSLFYYQGYQQEIENMSGFALSYGKQFSHESVVNVSAFTVAELGEMLPERLRLSGKRSYFPLYIKKNAVSWLIEYRKILNGALEGVYVEDYTEADSRAKMLIYLLENKLIDLKKDGKGKK